MDRRYESSIYAAQLFELRDEEFRGFQCRLMPDVPKERVIGVRTPVLRAYAKTLSPDSDDVRRFMQALPHAYYDENNLHAFLIERIQDFDICVAALDAFLPYVDNWATCDMMRPKVFAKHKDRLLPATRRWLLSDKTYTVRFGLEMLMSFFLDSDFDVSVLALASDVTSEEYYVNMMLAWFFATALAKQYDSVLPYIAERRLNAWTHNKTIQKACESRRITDEQKVFLRGLRIS